MEHHEKKVSEFILLLVKYWYLRVVIKYDIKTQVFQTFELIADKK